MEFALFRFNKRVIFKQALEYLMDMQLVSVKVQGENQDVIQVNEHKASNHIP